MSSSRNQRISNGIDSLITRLLAEIPDEDISSADERENNAGDFVRGFLEERQAQQMSSSLFVC